MRIIDLLYDLVNVFYSDKKELKGFINIAGGSLQNLDDGEMPNMFQVTCSSVNGGGEVFIMSALSAEDKEKWMSCLRENTVAYDLNVDVVDQQDHVFDIVKDEKSNVETTSVSF